MEIKKLICTSDNINLNNIKQAISDTDKLEINSFKGNKSMILDTYKRRLESLIDLSEQLDFHESLRTFINDLEKSNYSELMCHIVNVNNVSCMLLTDKENEMIIAALDWSDKNRRINLE